MMTERFDPGKTDVMEWEERRHLIVILLLLVLFLAIIVIAAIWIYSAGFRSSSLIYLGIFFSFTLFIAILYGIDAARGIVLIHRGKIRDKRSVINRLAPNSYFVTLDTGEQKIPGKYYRRAEPGEWITIRKAPMSRLTLKIDIEQ